MRKRLLPCCAAAALAALAVLVPAAGPASAETARWREYEDEVRVCYLTFDDGPSENTPKVLDILKEKNVPATFFVIGSETEQGRALYRRIVEEGHAIGNHSFTHEYDRIYSSSAAFTAEFTRLDALVFEETGLHTELFRFPGGSRQPRRQDAIRAIAAGLTAQGYVYCDWNVSAEDSIQPLPSSAQIVENVLRDARELQTAWVLCHDNAVADATVAALPALIDALRAEGFVFRPLSAASPVYQQISVSPPAGTLTAGDAGGAGRPA